MNVDNLNTLADHLDTCPPHSFYMGLWDCGTTACIGGHARRLWPDADVGEVLGLPSRYHVEDPERDLNANQLFYPSPEVCPELGDAWADTYTPLHDRVWSKDFEPSDAARVIRNLIATGKVDWSILS